MLLTIPERSRGEDLGAFGFPWLVVADIVIAAAHQGWSYYRTNQQIKRSMAASGTPSATPTDIDAITKLVEERLGPGKSKSEVSAYINDLIRSAPDKTQGVIPAQYLAPSGAYPPPQPSGMPTWGWLVIGVVGFLALTQFGILGGRR